MLGDILAALSDGCADCAQTLRRGRGKVHCPLTSDSTPSFDVQEGDNGVLVYCHACKGNQEGHIAALRERGLWGERAVATLPPAAKVIDAVYDYEGFQVVRYRPKAFVQRRRVGDSWVYDLEGVERVLFHRADVLAAVARDERIWIVEGEKDVLALRGHGLSATCNSGGAGKWADRYSLDLVNAEVVVVCDSDDVGRAHAREVAESLGLAAKGIKVIELPQKDVSDFFAAGGTKETLLEIADKAPAWSQDGRRILTGKDLVGMYSDVMAKRMSEDPDYVGVPTGLGALDEHIAYRVGDLILVVAATGVGKSALLTTMHTDLGRRGIDSMFVSLEMSWVAMVDRMISSGLALSTIGERPGLLVDEPSLTTARLETLCKVARLRGARIVFVDYAQRILGDKKDSEYERVTAVSNELARIARECRVCIVAAAQVSRQGVRADGAPPQLADIRASGHLEQDSAVVLSLGRKAGERDTRVAIMKNRWGGTGYVHLQFEPKRASFIADAPTKKDDDDVIPF